MLRQLLMLCAIACAACNGHVKDTFRIPPTEVQVLSDAVPWTDLAETVMAIQRVVTASTSKSRDVMSIVITVWPAWKPIAANGVLLVDDAGTYDRTTGGINVRAVGGDNTLAAGVLTHEIFQHRFPPP